MEIPSEQVAGQREDCFRRDAETSTREWEIIADNLTKAGWSWGCVSAVDGYARIILVADAHCDGQRFIVRAFLELESAIRACGEFT